jgi:hypothetical protein
MKITTSQKIIIPIVCLLLAFSILAFQHHENKSKSAHTDPVENSAIIKSTSKKLDTITSDREN